MTALAAQRRRVTSRMCRASALEEIRILKGRRGRLRLGCSELRDFVRGEPGRGLQQIGARAGLRGSAGEWNATGDGADGPDPRAGAADVGARGGRAGPAKKAGSAEQDARS